MRSRAPWLLIPSAGVSAFLLALILAWPGQASEHGVPGTGLLDAGNTSVEARMVHSRFCACCTDYAAYLRSHGVTVHQVTLEDMRELKRGLGITRELESCHTVFIEGYFVEGHVPVEAIAMLLEQRPHFNGIALPGMPPGSPGMDGIQHEPFVVYGIAGDMVAEFATVPPLRAQARSGEDAPLALEDAVCGLD
jgi:hypothetical protein